MDEVDFSATVEEERRLWGLRSGAEQARQAWKRMSRSERVEFLAWALEAEPRGEIRFKWEP